MSVRDINPDTVLDAIRDGSGDVDVAELAEVFEVLHVSHTLRSTLHQLSSDGLITIDSNHRITLT